MVNDIFMKHYQIGTSANVSIAFQLIKMWSRRPRLRLNKVWTAEGGYPT